MKKTAALTIIIILYIITNVYGTTYDENHNVKWQYAGYGIRDVSLTHVTAGHSGSGGVFISSEKALYIGSSSKGIWDEILSFMGNSTEITTVETSALNPNTIAVGTSNGLFISRDNGSRWRKASHGIGAKENLILSTAFSPSEEGTLFTGTAAGLFKSSDSGKTWVKNQGLPSNAVVPSIAINADDPAIIYAALNNSLYKSMDSGKRWKRIFITSYTYKRGEEQIIMKNENSPEAETLTPSGKIRKVLIDPYDSSLMYLATSEGLFISKDTGMTWKRSGTSGLTSGNLRHIIIDPDDRCCLYAATSRGIFRYSNTSDSWTQSYKGLNTANINHLAHAPKGENMPERLWAATDKGLYVSVTEAGMNKNKKTRVHTDEILSRFDNEPTIENIQKAAIIYAEVHPDKIKRWRKGAARKAWLPDLKLNLGRGNDWQSSTYFYSTSSEKYKDNDITEGNDKGWSVTLTWDLGDLIWSSDQTSIDTRSRLMVQLRDDVLNEITRLYYERRRLQIEMMLYPAADTLEAVEMALRLEELTADIDAMTGFSFSERPAEKSASAGSLH